MNQKEKKYKMKAVKFIFAFVLLTATRDKAMLTILKMGILVAIIISLLLLLTFTVLTKNLSEIMQSLVSEVGQNVVL